VHDVVLLDRFVVQLLVVASPGSVEERGIEHVLLDLGVDFQLFLDRAQELLSLAFGAAGALLQLAEQLPDSLVILLEQGDRVPGRLLPCGRLLCRHRLLLFAAPRRRLDFCPVSKGGAMQARLRAPDSSAGIVAQRVRRNYRRGAATGKSWRASGRLARVRCVSPRPEVTTDPWHGRCSTCPPGEMYERSTLVRPATEQLRRTLEGPVLT